MARPQSPELRRSGRTEALEPDNTVTRLEAEKDLVRRGRSGPVPPDNRPGHHPGHEQDQPDLEAFVERFNRAGRAEAHTAQPAGDSPEVREAGLRERTPESVPGLAAPHPLERGSCAIARLMGLEVRLVRSTTAMLLRATANWVEPAPPWRAR